MKAFREKFTLEERIAECERIKQKYPERVPIIIEQAAKSSLPPLDRYKYLVPDLTVGQFIYSIRKRMSLPQEQALFVFFNNELPPTSSMVKDIYTKLKSEDGFLYGTIHSESCFGLQN